jgi:hypothetical protein
VTASADRIAGRAARLTDRVLDFLVLGFGAWTAVYHACLVLGVGVLGAAIALVIFLVPCAWLAFRGTPTEIGAPDEDAPAPGPPWARRTLLLALGGYALAAAVSAGVFAFASAGWAVTWALVFVTAAAGAALVYLGSTGRLVPDVPKGLRVWPGALAALGWAAGLAVLSLFLVRPDSDDTQYVHLSTWVAERGDFPLRDTLFSDERFPAIIYPPLSSFEGLVGMVARGVGVSAPSVTYYLVPPLASALAALATWRLLRAWRVRMVALALTTAMVFLLMAAQEHRTLGSLFVGRIWQGKIVFLAVLVPLLFVLLQEYAGRPTRRQLLLLFAGGAAGVGLTSTGTFLVPVLAVGCLAPLALRATRQAAVGLAAAAAYPLGALLVSTAVGGRRAGGDLSTDVVADEIARLVLGSGLFAFIGLAAALLGPVVLPGRRAAVMAAATVLLVACLYAPPVPHLIWELSGIGRVLWRVVWVVPVAALVGVVVTAVPLRAPLALRAAPALALCVVLLVWGTPVWGDGALEGRPSWKREPREVSAARRILAHARPGDVVLAPSQVGQTLLVMSDDVTTVSPRAFYVRALDGEPAAHVLDRLVLQSLLEPTLRTTIPELPKEPPTDAEVERALRTVGVDIACVRRRPPETTRALRAAGYAPEFRAAGLVCTTPRA